MNVSPDWWWKQIPERSTDREWSGARPPPTAARDEKVEDGLGWGVGFEWGLQQAEQKSREMEEEEEEGV